MSTESYLEIFSSLPVISLPHAQGREILAIIGGGHVDSSHKNLLALGMLVLSRETKRIAPGQTIIESSSGSMAEGLAVAGKLTGHPIVIVSDPSLPKITRRKIKLLGAELCVVTEPHPTLGWQEARERKVREIVAQNPSMHWLDQNNNPLNPEVYRRWLIPQLERRVRAEDVDVLALCVGSGGHFSALADWLKRRNPDAKCVAIDRVGSITFGGAAGPSRIRGVGNQNIVPDVIAGHRELVDEVVTVTDIEAFQAVRTITNKHGIFVGGSSGAVFAGVMKIFERDVDRRYPTVLTLFPDRGELYWDTILDDTWMAGHGLSASLKRS